MPGCPRNFAQALQIPDFSLSIIIISISSNRIRAGGMNQKMTGMTEQRKAALSALQGLTDHPSAGQVFQAARK